MRILHTADWHLGKIVNGYNMITNQQNILNQIKTIINENEIDIIIIAGDIYDRSIPSIESINLFNDFINEIIIEMKKKVIIIPGNHDSVERLGFGKNLLKKANLYVAGSLKEEVDYYDIENVRFYLFPYTNLFNAKEILKQDFSNMDQVYRYLINKILIDEERFNVALVHDYVTYNMEKLLESESERDISIGGLEYVDAKIFDQFSYVALGHLHQAQKVGKPNIRYSGSPLKYSFSEALNHKSVTIIDTQGKVTLVPLKPINDLVIIEGFLNDIIQESFYQNYNYKVDFFKVVLKDEDEVIDAYAKLKSIYPNLMEIYKERQGGQIKILSKKEVEGKPLNELFSSFYEYVTFNKLTDNEEKFVSDILRGELK